MNPATPSKQGRAHLSRFYRCVKRVFECATRIKIIFKVIEQEKKILYWIARKYLSRKSFYDALKVN